MMEPLGRNMNNELIAICLGVALSSMIVAGVALAMACVCWSKVVGLQNSTHQIQYVPLEDEKGEQLVGEALEKNIKKAMGQEEIERDYV